MKVRHWLLLFGLCFGTDLWAQTGPDVYGRVTDASGHAISGATVVGTCNHGGISNKSVSNANGEYQLGFNEPNGALCSLEVTAPGYRAALVPAAKYHECGNLKLDFELARTSLSSDASAVADDSKSRWEYGVLIQGGNGLQDRTDFHFLMAGAHLGKILTSDFGTGLFKGNIEYAVEVLPFWQSYTPKFQRLSCAGASSDPACSQPYTVGGTYTGSSITPIMLRYNFTHGKRFMPWIQAAGGVVWTNHKYPAVGNLDPTDPTQTGPAADTSVWNFTPQGGIGAHYFLKPKRSIDVSINGVHVSSASLGDKNPGVNASVQVSVGYSWWK